MVHYWHTSRSLSKHGKFLCHTYKQFVSLFRIVRYLMSCDLKVLQKNGSCTAGLIIALSRLGCRNKWTKFLSSFLFNHIVNLCGIFIICIMFYFFLKISPVIISNMRDGSIRFSFDSNICFFLNPHVVFRLSSFTKLLYSLGQPASLICTSSPKAPTL